MRAAGGIGGEAEVPFRPASNLSRMRDEGFKVAGCEVGKGIVDEGGGARGVRVSGYVGVYKGENRSWFRAVCLPVVGTEVRYCDLFRWTTFGGRSRFTLTKRPILHHRKIHKVPIRQNTRDDHLIWRDSRYFRGSDEYRMLQHFCPASWTKIDFQLVDSLKAIFEIERDAAGGGFYVRLKDADHNLQSASVLLR